MTKTFFVCIYCREAVTIIWNSDLFSIPFRFRRLTSGDVPVFLLDGLDRLRSPWSLESDISKVTQRRLFHSPPDRPVIGIRLRQSRERKPDVSLPPNRVYIYLYTGLQLALHAKTAIAICTSRNQSLTGCQIRAHCRTIEPLFDSPGLICMSDGGGCRYPITDDTDFPDRDHAG